MDPNSSHEFFNSHLDIAYTQKSIKMKYMVGFSLISKSLGRSVNHIS